MRFCMRSPDTIIPVQSAGLQWHQKNNRGRPLWPFLVIMRPEAKNLR
uniref:Uncharacterized protein n=1 Tax=Anguilla anguilla TaxID=7936 RepID=A0A0E9PRH2_ANGAN